MGLVKVVYCANFVDRYNRFIYIDSIKTYDTKSLTFLNTLIASTAHFVTIIKDIYKSPHKLLYWYKKMNKINIDPINKFYPHLFYYQKQIDSYFNDINITEICIVYTDGSHENNIVVIGYEDIASYGIYIRFSNKEYKISQPIGTQSILYAEQYVIAVVPHILDILKINAYNRLIVMTDNLITFESRYKLTNKPIYPTLINKIRNMLNEHTIINKVKSHQLIDSIVGNNYADFFAKECMYKNYEGQSPFTPWFTWENLTIACRDLRCYGLTDFRECWDILDPG